MQLDNSFSDDRSIAQAYEELGPGLRRYVAARSRDAASAEDICHEAFVTLAAETRAGRGPANRSAWLHRVALNLIISRSRRTEVARRHSASMSLAEFCVPSPEDYVLAAERTQVLQALLEHVSPVARTSLVLAAQGYTGLEIARAIGRSEGATRTLMCRARNELRRELVGSYSDAA
ncbi:MAG: RNA polymerase sigma factor [Thermomicrobiales bacterium]|nr:MAG: RNA polymerase sigma factor [Thermomicrobiales bacterium]